MVRERPEFSHDGNATACGVGVQRAGSESAEVFGAQVSMWTSDYAMMPGAARREFAGKPKNRRFRGGSRLQDVSLHPPLAPSLKGKGNERRRCSSQLPHCVMTASRSLTLTWPSPSGEGAMSLGHVAGAGSEAGGAASLPYGAA